MVGLNPHTLRIHALRIGLIFLLLAPPGHGADSLPGSRIDPRGISGSLVIAGGGQLPEAIAERFVELAGGKEARLLIVPTAAAEVTPALRDRLLTEWRALGPAEVAILHADSRAEADQDAAVAQCQQATGVWFGGGQQTRLAERYVGTRIESALHDLLARGGVIGGTSAGAAIQSRLMIARGLPVAEVGTGLDLLPGTVIDQHFSQRQRAIRLRAVIQANPGHLGIGVDEATALVVRGRRLEVLGKHAVHVLWAEREGRPARQLQLTAGDAADLIALRREARERLGPPFPPPAFPARTVPQGTLFLGGGGRMPAAAMRLFVERAGGAAGHFVILPTASDAAQPTGAAERRLLESAGAKHLTVLPGRSREEVESPASLAALSQATGIWFGGGRQWRFVDAYEGTRALELFRQVLQRGGAIGGSSAGASIQGEYLARGDPLGNQEIMAAGYERGFGFLPGTAVDQHFTQRRRQADLQALVEKFPQLLGVGIDESTMLVVQGEQAEVMGDHAVHFFVATPGQPLGPPIALRAGERFHLPTQQKLSN